MLLLLNFVPIMMKDPELTVTEVSGYMADIAHCGSQVLYSDYTKTILVNNLTNS